MYKKNTTGQFVALKQVTTAGANAATIPTLITRRIDGVEATFTGTVSAFAGGTATISMSAADCNGSHVSWNGTLTGCVDSFAQFTTEVSTPTDNAATMANLSSAQLQGFTNVQTGQTAISANLGGLTSAQLSGLTALQTSANNTSSNLAGLTSGQVAGFASVQSAQLNGFTTAATATAAVLTQATIARKIVQNETITDVATGLMTVKDDAGAALYSAQIYDDAAGATPYTGTGAINKRKKFT